MSSPPPAVARAIELADRGTDFGELYDEVFALASPEVRGTTWWFEEWFVDARLGVSELADKLRSLEPAVPSVAPRLVAVAGPAGDPDLLVARYDACPGERLEAVRGHPGPFHEAAKRAALDALRALHARGLWHARASDPEYWLRSERTGALVLWGWSNLRPLDREADRFALPDVEALLDGLPWYHGTPEGARALVPLYRAHLRSPVPTPELAAALYAAGRPLESELVRAAADGRPAATVTDGAWEGAVAHLGSLPPASAAPGELWLDPLELTAAVFVGTTWLSLSAVAFWQLLVWQEVPGAPAFDRGQLRPMWRDEDLRDPVGGATPSEADALVGLAGKRLPTRADWSAARSSLTPRRFGDLWALAGSEWIAPEDGRRLAINGEGAEVPGSEGARDRCTGFRTASSSPPAPRFGR